MEKYINRAWKAVVRVPPYAFSRYMAIPPADG
jgi:hypothetical protein